MSEGGLAAEPFPAAEVPRELVDLAIVGAGAAGLMAAIAAGRTARALGRPLRVLALDGAVHLGAKLLVAGGGRCNVTHEVVHEGDFSGSTPAAIRKVLRGFDVAATRTFFEALGVELKRESTGKLFPVTDRARTVLDALLAAAADAGVELRHPARVARLEPPTAPGVRWLVGGSWGAVGARRLVLATGGLSLPKSGSDGWGIARLRALGHAVTPRLAPALVPLLLPDGHPLRTIPGLASEVALVVEGASGARRQRVVGPLLCTHFGISGPAVLDISRHLDAARSEDPGARLVVDWWPGCGRDDLDHKLAGLGPRSVRAALRERLPERLADVLAGLAAVDPEQPGHQLTRTARQRLVGVLKQLVLPVVGDRGFTHAEVTAGGVPLSEVRLPGLESRRLPGLHLCGELLDVDGRIGGFNFQWAWASGQAAGAAAARALTADDPGPPQPGPNAAETTLDQSTP